ncbi:MAG: hypothetical protein J6R18_01515 [Kiritimatiellae bacterium]|nr:hypothetical protein [Kiritimatiellia bacterium]
MRDIKNLCANAFCVSLFAVFCGLVPLSSFAAKATHLEDATSVSAKKASSLPEILLIGDSIRIGYCAATAEALKGKAEVRWPKGNCQNSQNILITLPRWKGLVASPAIVQFNCGHWDAACWDGDADAITSLEEYARNIRKIIHRLRRYWPEAKIVFATTTPMNPDGRNGRNARTTESIRRYNEVAVSVAKAEGIAVNDLFSTTEKWPSSDFSDYCHFNKAAAKRLGKIVAEYLADRL